jgi:F-type H+-transporting ATPase subunit b
MVRDAREEARQMVQDSRKSSQDIVEKAREDARLEGQEILEKARKEAAGERQRILDEARERADLIAGGAKVEDSSVITRAVDRLCGLEE